MKRLAVYSILLIALAGTAFNTETFSEKEKKEVVCFVYHRIGDKRYPTTNTSIPDFEAHLSYLHKKGFRVLNFSQAIDYLKSDDAPQKTAVITIDDGYKSFYKNGYPLLKKYEFTATLFINTKSVGGGDMMSWEEIETVSKNNLEIGNHTHSHDFFLNENATTRYKKFKDEIELSQSIIKEKLGFAPVVFTYPYGEFDTEMKQIVKGFEFKAAAAQNSGVLSLASDLLMCPRFPMSESYASIEQFAEKASMKAMPLKHVSPETFLLDKDKRPELLLTIEKKNLRTNQFQCFVQGGACELKIVKQTDTEVVVSIRAAKPISKRRRTLYTLTVPDVEGKWHWYSHLWIDPAFN